MLEPAAPDALGWLPETEDLPVSDGETRIDGETVYDGRIVRLEVDRVRLRDGGESVREVVRHAGAVVVLPVCDDGSMVLLRQFRYPTGEVLLEAPAGKLDVQGESEEDCARRELTEETGLEADGMRPLGSFYTSPGFSDEVLHCFAATGLRPADEPAVAEPEILEVVRLRAGEVDDAIRAGRIRDAKTLAILLLARVHDGAG